MLFIVVILLLRVESEAAGTTAAPQNITCPPGFHGHAQNCYLFSHGTATWADAYLFCKLSKAHLVEIEDDSENTFLANHVRSQGSYWYIGGLDPTIDGEFFWATSKAPFSNRPTHWKAGEPNVRANYDCVVLEPVSAAWYATGCNTQYHYICEMYMDEEI